MIGIFYRPEMATWGGHVLARAVSLILSSYKIENTVHKRGEEINSINGILAVDIESLEERFKSFGVPIMVTNITPMWPEKQSERALNRRLRRRGYALKEISHIFDYSLGNRPYLSERTGWTYAPIGYHELFEIDRKSNSDIVDVSFLGLSLPRSRRDEVMRRLEKRYSVRWFGSKSNAGWGEHVLTEAEYFEVLDDFLRTKIFLNLNRRPDLKLKFQSMRVVMQGMCNCAFVLSDTLAERPDWLLESEHYVETTADKIPDRVKYFLEHEKERWDIAENAYRFVKDRYRMVDLWEEAASVIRERAYAG